MSGKIICELIPTEHNKRNSEGTFIKLKNNSILYAYSRYRSEGLDHSTADLYAIVSTDEGETFGKPFLLFSCDDVGADNIMSASFVRLRNGKLGLFYIRKNNKAHIGIPYLAISSDEGKTWEKHVRCIEEDGYYVLNNDRVIALNNGRLLLPVAKHEYVDGVLRPGIILIYASDDDGISWRRISGEIKQNIHIVKRRVIDNHYALHSCMEPGVVQLDNGDIWCYIRTPLGRQYETFSEDMGESWTPLQPSPFTSAVSPMCVKKLRSGNLFAVWNPVPLYNGKDSFVEGVNTAGRTPFVFTILDKEGEIVSDITKIEDDKSAGYCYCAIYETEKGDILLGYCSGGVKDKTGSCLNKTTIRKIYKSELEII